MTKSEAVYIEVGTKDSIASCKCYLKSFWEQGFKTLTVNIALKSKCGLKEGYTQQFESLGDINLFCSKDPFRPKNMNKDENIYCGIELER